MDEQEDLSSFELFDCAPPNFNIMQPKVLEALKEDREK